MRKMLFITLLMGGLCTTVSVAKAQERLPEYLQAEKYTQEKLNTMLFSTVVDPHWFQKGNNFWFEYKTSEGTFWYVVDPAARTKKLLFDRDELASQLSQQKMRHQRKMARIRRTRRMRRKSFIFLMTILPVN